VLAMLIMNAFYLDFPSAYILILCEIRYNYKCMLETAYCRSAGSTSVIHYYILIPFYNIILGKLFIHILTSHRDFNKMYLYITTKY